MRAIRMGTIAHSQHKSLQDLIDSTPDLVDYLYNDTLGPHSRGRGSLSPVPAEFSNWRDEQRAWRNTAVLFDQSHHMPELFLKGPDALRLLSKIGINSFANFAPGRAKQLVGCNPSGQMIGDCVLHFLKKDSFELISGMPLLNWVHYHAETGGYDVSIVRDHNTSNNPTGKRTNFRYGMDGPNAWKIFSEVVEGEVTEIPFFRTARIKIAGVSVLALRHGMAGHHGVELSGAYEEGPKVRAALLQAGARYGLRPGGTRAYFSTAYESGWIAYPLPAIYTGDDMRGFREWLRADSWESQFQLGGSFRSRNLEDYYVTPWDLGYDRILKFDHDFIGRDALERRQHLPHRSKVTLVWNREDVLKVFGSMLQPEAQYKYIDLPIADYGFPHLDEVKSENGKLIGLSALCGYSV